MSRGQGDIAWQTEMGSGTQTWIRVLVLPLMSSVTLSQSWDLLSFCFFFTTESE